MARKARWLGLLATYRELLPEERDAVDRALEGDPWARELKLRFDEQDALLASLQAPRLSPAVRERVMAATVARGVGTPESRRRPVLAVALALLLLVMVGGTGVASSGSLPGDALYPVKRAAEEVRMILTLRDQGRTQYAERLGEIRRQEVNALLDLGRAGIPVEFEGPLEHAPTGEWTVAGVPIQLPEEPAQTSLADGSPVYILGEIDQARVRVQTMRPLTSSAVPPAGSLQPQPRGQGGEQGNPAHDGPTPAAAGKTPEPSSHEPTEAPAHTEDGATATPAPTLRPTPAPTLSPTKQPANTPDEGGNRPHEERTSEARPARSPVPGQEKAPPPTTPDGRGPDEAPEADTAAGSRAAPPAGDRPTAAPRNAADASPRGQPQPARRPSRAAPPARPDRPQPPVDRADKGTPTHSNPTPSGQTETALSPTACPAQGKAATSEGCP